MNNTLKILWFLSLAALLGFFGYFSYQKAVKLRDLRRQLRDYRQREERLKSEKAVLEKEIDGLLHDPGKLEELAREKLRLAGENERIFIIEPTPPPPRPKVSR